MDNPLTGQVSGANNGNKMTSNTVSYDVKPVFIRLGLLMFLQFVVFGSWFSTLGLVLITNNLASIVGYAYALSAVAALFSPAFVGALGDRFISAEKLLAIASFIGAAIQFALPAMVTGGHAEWVLVLIFLYMLTFQPTLGLANTVCFEHLGEHQKLFPFLRIFATLAWVLAGVCVGVMGLSASPHIFMLAGGASVVLGLYALTLPKTPPKKKDARLNWGDIVGVHSFPLFKMRNFSVLMLCAVMTSISLGFYNSFASAYLGALKIENVAAVLAIGQVTEVIFIALVPFVLLKIGMKYGLLIGMGMWGVRFIIFIAAAHGHKEWAILGIALHGICNDFFIVLSAMYIDKITPKEMKAQAQSWLIIAISGVGSGIGAVVSGNIFGGIVASNQVDNPLAWTQLWIVPIGIAVVTSVVWLFGFRRNAAGLTGYFK